MNKNYKKDIKSFLDYTEGKTDQPTSKALQIYRKYENSLKDINSWPSIFGDLYGGIYVCHMGGSYYTIDGVHDCFPKTSYKSFEDLYQSHQKGIPLTLRSVWENFYNGMYDCFLEEYPDYNDISDTSCDQIVSDFYNLAFKGGKFEDACIEAQTLYNKYRYMDIYSPELWAEIFNEILHDYLDEDFLRTEDDGYSIVHSLAWYSKKDYGSFEEIYRDILGWEDDTLDLRDVWNKFYKHYLRMIDELKHEFDDNWV